MNKIVSTMLAMLLMLASFSTTASAAKKNSGSVAYTVLNNYYHNNNAPLPRLSRLRRSSTSSSAPRLTWVKAVSRRR